MASVNPLNTPITPKTNHFNGLSNSPAAGGTPNNGTPGSIIPGASPSIDYEYAIRLYRQFDTNLNEINDLWKDIRNFTNNGKELDISISALLKLGFDPKTPVGALVIDNLRKSAAASALLASAISQYLINLGDKNSPPLHKDNVANNRSVKYPIRQESLPLRKNGALFGGEKKKSSKSKKPLTSSPKKTAPKKKSVKKNAKKDAPKKKSVKK